MSTVPQAVLFVRLRLLGDIIMSIPTLLRFKQVYPEIPVFYALEEPFSGLGQLLPGIEEVFVVPSKPTIRYYRNWRSEIRKKGIDTVIDLHSGPKSALLTRLSGCPVRVGYRTRNRNWAYTRLNENRGDETRILHSVVNQISMLDMIGIKEHTPPPYRLKIPVNSLSLPDDYRLNSNTGIGEVALHVGAGNRFRYWGDSRYEQLITALVGEGAICHLIGYHHEESLRAKKWTAISESKVINWVGKLSIPETLALINRCDCYFGPDSGPLHLASLTKTPIVGLYGPNIPAISGPWREMDITILEASLPCRPCSQRDCRYDTIHCMEVIDAKQVFQSILGYLVK